MPVLQADYSSLSKYNISTRLVVRQLSSPPFNNFPYADPLAGIFCPRKKMLQPILVLRLEGDTTGSKAYFGTKNEERESKTARKRL